MSKCGNCPVVSGACVGERTSHAFACKMAAGRGESERLWIVGESASTPPVPAMEYPPLATQIGNAVQATARYIASGFGTVDQAEHDARLAICLGCEHYDASQARCVKCGCYTAAKLWSKPEKCPTGKW